jgi:hypothetical protein
LDHKLSWLLCANPNRDISDHSPCLISISTDIPKAKIFKFENYWLLHDEFMPTLEHVGVFHAIKKIRKKI